MPKSICIKNVLVFDGNKFLGEKNMELKNGKIEAIHHASQSTSCEQIIDGQGHILAPGFIDMQVNGGGGFLFNDNPVPETIFAIQKALLKYGTTSFFPTFITDHADKMHKAVEAVKNCIKQNIPGILGIHLEGPFLNPEKKGIHEPSFFRLPAEEDLEKLFSVQKGVVLLTLAPEMFTPKALSQLAASHVTVFCGHSNATYAQAETGFKKGVRGVTHLFNACSPLTSREAGVVGASLLSQTTWCGIIADGIHISKETLQIAFEIKKKDKFIFVSDSMPPVGTDLKSFFIGHNEIFVAKDRYIDSHGTLAGAALTLHDALCYVVKEKLLTLEEALPMTSTNAATCFGLDEKNSLGCLKGRVLPGYDADFVVLNKTTLDLMHVVQMGEIKEK